MDLKRVYAFLYEESSVNAFAARLKGFKEAEELAAKIREEERLKETDRKRIDEDIDRYNRNVLCPSCERVVFRGQHMSREEALSLEKIKYFLL